MASLKDMRVRLASTKATQKITKAMQMVAASKLRRAQAAAEAARPYAERMDAVLGNIATGMAGSDGAPKLLGGTGSDRVHLLIVATGERGLAGAFNSSIVRLAREHINRLHAEGKEVKILTVGKKGYEQLRRNYEKNIVDRIELRGVRVLGYVNASGIADKVLAMFEKGEFDVATLFYSRFKSVISQIPTAQQIIPPKIESKIAGSEKPAASAAAYDYEPEEDEILADLLPRYIATQIFRALLENNASFYGSQMSAMDNATRNAGDMIRKQTIKYNRTRQAMITKELIEIISGAEAL
jgi:F-type H+-transporting ATPase subunit gamma